MPKNSRKSRKGASRKKASFAKVKGLRTSSARLRGESRNNRLRNQKVYGPLPQSESKEFDRGASRRRKSTGLGAMLGGAIFPEFGPLGPLAGNVAESLLNNVTGSGAYSEIVPSMPLSSNSLAGVQTPEAAQAPLMHKDKGVTRVTHREYVGDVPMTVGFRCTSYDLTPFSAVTFPWLSQMADQYSQFKILGMIVEFRSLAANAVAGANAGMGSVSLSCCYDVWAAPPASKTESNNALYAVSCKPSESMQFAIECEPDVTVSQPLFINPTRYGTPGGLPLATSPDPRAYKFARLDLVTVGSSADYAGAGELWITYDIMMLKPVAQVPRLSAAIHIQLAIDDNTKPLKLLAGTSQPVWNSLNPSYGPVTINGTAGTVVLPYLLPINTEILVFQVNKGAAVANNTQPSIQGTNGLQTENDYFGDTQQGTVTAVNAGTTTVSAGFLAFRYDGTGTAALPPTLSWGATAAIYPVAPIIGGDVFIYFNSVGFL